MAANLNPNLNPNVVGGAGGNQPPQPDEPKDSRFFWLTVFQYILIAAVAVIFVFVLAGGAKTTGNLGNIEEARGLITFVISVGTIAIAIILALAAILIRDFEKRLGVGKEILTILVAVLGTIVGFYYGAAKKETPPAQISSALRITPPELARDDKVTISVSLTGGTPPYTYTVKFTPDKIPPVPVKDSATGEINEDIPGTAVPADAKEVGFLIEGKDKTGAPFAINKDGKQKIQVKP